jgi:hypothetical protein
MILHYVDSNSSWLEAMRNQLGGKLILACAWALAQMQCRRLFPKHQILNNQASGEYKATIEASGMTYELVPPKEHQRNMAEKAIQTFKDHIVGVLSGCAPSMPIHLWCQLLPQVEWQLLFRQQSRAHPNLLAYAHVYKHHDYNWHPFVPICMEALVPQMLHLSQTLHKSIFPGHVHQTLSILEVLDPHNTHHGHLLGSFFQAQIPNQPIGHARGLSNCRSSMPHGHSPRHQASSTSHLYPPSTR